VKFFQLDDGILAGRLRRNCDPRAYQAPKVYWAYAEIINEHPSPQHEGEVFAEPQWWLFLVPRTISHIMSALYCESISEIEAIKQLCKFPSSLLAEQIVDCLNRGNCRPLFCGPDGEPYYSSHESQQFLRIH
jgi:hypothetical protein